MPSTFFHARSHEWQSQGDNVGPRPICLLEFPYHFGFTFLVFALAVVLSGSFSSRGLDEVVLHKEARVTKSPLGHLTLSPLTLPFVRTRGIEIPIEKAIVA